MGQPVRRVLFRRTVAGPAATIIHLRTPLPTPSSGLPGHSGEQPSNVPCLALLQVGFTLPFQSPGKRWSLTPPFHPYLCKQRRSVFCGTGLRVAPSGRYPPPCSTEPGRSSGCSHNTRSSSCPIRPSSIAGCATPGISVSPGPVWCCGKFPAACAATLWPIFLPRPRAGPTLAGRTNPRALPAAGAAL
jgi:hypothetical protein